MRRAPRLLAVFAALLVLHGCVVDSRGNVHSSPYTSKGSLFESKGVYRYHPLIDLVELVVCPLLMPVDILLAIAPHIGGDRLAVDVLALLPGINAHWSARRELLPGEGGDPGPR